MSLYPRDPNATPSATGYPITRTFAATVLVALLLLVVLRHLFGSVRVEAGVR
jgi:hypothetical protein